MKSANDCDFGRFSGFIVGHLMGHREHLFIHFEHSGTNSYEISGMELTPIVNTLVQCNRSSSFPWHGACESGPIAQVVATKPHGTC